MCFSYRLDNDGESHLTDIAQLLFVRALMERVGELRQQFCDELQVFFPNMSNQLLFRSVEALGAVMLSESLNHAEEILRAAHPDRERMNEERSMFCAQLISGGLCQLSKRYTQR